MKTIASHHFAVPAPITRDIKFTDALERELICEELAANYDSTFISRESIGPLLKWIGIVALAIGSVCIIINANL